MSQLIANACRKRRASKLPASVVIFVTYFSILQLVMCKAPTTGAREHQRHRRLVEASPSKSFILPAMMLGGLVADFFACRRRKKHSQQAQPLQRAQLADASSARAAGINAIPATTTDNTPQEGYDFWHPPQYQPAESSQADLQLSPWETATVFDSGLQPHPGRAHLDTGNSSCTLITSRFAKQLGLVNFDCRPTQAYSGTIRVSGIVHGMHIDLPIINIQYEIQGQKIYSRAGLSDQSSHNSWTYSSPAMRSGYLSQMASDSQQHAIEAMRTQTIDQQRMQSQVEQDEILSARNWLPNACNNVYVMFLPLINQSINPINLRFWYLGLSIPNTRHDSRTCV